MRPPISWSTSRRESGSLSNHAQQVHAIKMIFVRQCVSFGERGQEANLGGVFGGSSRNRGGCIRQAKLCKGNHVQHCGLDGGGPTTGQRWQTIAAARHGSAPMNGGAESGCPIFHCTHDLYGAFMEYSTRPVSPTALVRDCIAASGKGNVPGLTVRISRTIM